MNLTIFMTVFILMAVGESFARPEDNNDAHGNHQITQEDIKKYLEMLEKLDIDKLLNNTRLMSNNVKCFMNEGPCTAQLNEMKSKWYILIILKIWWVQMNILIYKCSNITKILLIITFVSRIYIRKGYYYITI